MAQKKKNHATEIKRPPPPSKMLKNHEKCHKKFWKIYALKKYFKPASIQNVDDPVKDFQLRNESRKFIVSPKDSAIL